MYCKIFFHSVFDFCPPGGTGGSERTAYGDRRVRRDDISEDDRSVRPGAELLEAVRRHELSASRRRRRRRQDAAARGAPLVTATERDAADHEWCPFHQQLARRRRRREC